MHAAIRLSLTLAFLLSQVLSFGQQKPFILSGKLLEQQVDIGPYTIFFEDHSGDTSLRIIPFQGLKPFAHKRNERTSFAHQSILMTYLRFSLRNVHPTDTLHVMHRTGTHGHITLYCDRQILAETGVGLPALQRADRFSLPIAVPPATEQTYTVRIIDYFWSPTPIISQLATIHAGVTYEFGQRALSELVLLAVMSTLTGCFLFMCFYALYSFLLNRDRTFLYYTLYTLTCILFSAHCIDVRFGFHVLFPYRISDALGPFHISLIGAFYALFIAEVVSLKTTLPALWKTLQVLILLLFIQEIEAVAEYVNGQPFFTDNTIYIYAMLPTGLTTVLLAIAVILSASPIRYYLLGGMISLVLIAFMPASLDVYFGNLSLAFDTVLNYPFFWLVLGLAIESLCFALALAYRGQLIELENRSIQERYAGELESQLTQRSREIEKQSHMLEAQQIRQMEAGFEQRLAETEMTALRAQMNPHFIFNCLNSIKLYTLENDSDRASEYLTMFSRLIRLVLENSQSQHVTLQNELNALGLYMELEAMRFKQKVNFSIQVSPGIDQRYIRIPPLLLQPYVENSIWHGLMHKQHGGTVLIEVTQPQENLLRIEITDDGIGRQRAAWLRSKSAGNQKSFGMQVTADRIRIINQLYNIHTQADVFDLVDSEGQACGTKVILQIPV